MTQADRVLSTPPTNTSANNPAGLARQQRERERALRRVAKLRRKASDEIDRLLAFLDASDPYVSTELEQEDGNDEPGGHDEPSLGSFDRMTDQEKSWRKVDRNPDVYGWSGGVDNEQDDCDYEDADPDEAKQQPAVM
jgi:hypothetical protein